MLPQDIRDALDSILGDMNSEELDKKRKKYAPPEPKDEQKPVHGVSITIVTGKHPEPEGDEADAKGAEPLESPEELAKLLSDEDKSDDSESADKEEEKPKAKPKKLRRY